jgi:hypothetical protein
MIVSLQHEVYIQKVVTAINLANDNLAHLDEILGLKKEIWAMKWEKKKSTCELEMSPHEEMLRFKEEDYREKLGFQTEISALTSRISNLKVTLADLRKVASKVDGGDDHGVVNSGRQRRGRDW